MPQVDLSGAVEQLVVLSERLRDQFVFVANLSCLIRYNDLWFEKRLGLCCENNAFPTDGAKLLVLKSRVDFYNLTS